MFSPSTFNHHGGSIMRKPGENDVLRKAFADVRVNPSLNVESTPLKSRQTVEDLELSELYTYKDTYDNFGCFSSFDRITTDVIMNILARPATPKPNFTLADLSLDEVELKETEYFTFDGEERSFSDEDFPEVEEPSIQLFLEFDD